MNNNDDNKDLNTEEEVIETTTPDAATAVDVSPVGEEPEKATPEVAAEITEELAEQIEEELEDSDNGDETPAQHAAEEEVAAAVEEENEAAMEAEGVDAPTETVDETTVDEAPAEEDPKDANPNAKWYVVHTYSGHENRVATNLRQRIETEALEHKIVDILVPTQDKIEIRGGKKEQVKEKLFPGYMYVKMELDNSTWIAVRTTQGVIGFVGAGTKPMPISDSEVKSIMQFMNQGAAPTFKEVFNVDDPVKIIDGPFADFIGKIESVDKEKGKLRVLVSIFGRETPVELDFLQVSKL